MSVPQTGDYQWFLKGTYTLHPHELGVQFQPIQGIPFTRNGVIEVKEVAHDARLPYHNFSPDSVGRMVIRQMAGSEALVLVCFRPKTGPSAGKTFWRSAPLDFFRNRDPERPSGSWDMSDLDAYTHCDDILQEYLK
jgi:hypothetical protein